MYQRRLTRWPACACMAAGLCLAMAGGGAQAQAAAPGAAQPAKPAAGESPLALSDDGALVIDRTSRLAWTRCVEGMAWDGHTCTGQPRRMTYGDALARASGHFTLDQLLEGEL